MMETIIIQNTEPEFSIFENHTATIGTKTTLAAVHNKITDPNSPLVGRTQSIHSIYNANGGGKKGKKAIAPLKAQLPAAAFGATGDRKVVEKASGLICLDLDELDAEKLEEVRRFLQSCRFVALEFVSPSGAGLKAVFRIPVINGADQKQMRARFKITFKAISQFIYENTGAQADAACSDMLRLTYLPHDADAQLNDYAVEFPVNLDAEARSTLEVSPQIEAPRSKPAPIEIVRPLLFSIAPRPSYDIWMKICASVRNSLGNNKLAIDILKAWSPEEVDGEYASLLDSSPFDEIGIGTLRYHAGLNDYFAVFECFAYDESTGHFLLRWGSYWIRLRGEGVTKDHLRQFLGKLPSDCPLCEIRTTRNVAWAGEIAGYHAGIQEFSGRRLLIMDGPKIVASQERDWPVLRNFFETLFPDDCQRHSFLAWLAHCRHALLSGYRKQTPAVALVGDRGNGKTLVINITNRCLGNRSASAYRFLSGLTPFNADLIRSELLAIDDEAASTDFRTRLTVAQNIKAFFFAEGVRLEPKKVDSITVSPIQALVIAVNSDPQHIRVLPEMDATMRDKIMLLQTAHGEIPADLRGSNLLESVLMQEIPGFLHYIENQDFSSHYESGRLRCYWHPSVVEALNIMSPEIQLLSLITSTQTISGTYRPGGVVPEFTAPEIQAALMENPGTRHAAANLLSYPNACGVYLGKLADLAGSGISRGRMDPRKRIQRWLVDLQEEEGARQ